MKMRLLAVFLALALVLMPSASTPSAAGQLQEDSLVDVWVFEDLDRNGIYSAGDRGYTDIPVCLYNIDNGTTSCVGTDEGDVWWEISEAGLYATRADLKRLRPDYRLRSIQCRHTRTNEIYAGCYYKKGMWAAGFDLPYGTRLNIFYAVVRR